MVVIDPPFITRDVWEKYAKTSNFLLKESGSADNRVLCTTVNENADMMFEFFKAKPQVSYFHMKCCYFTTVHHSTVLVLYSYNCMFVFM